MPYDENFLGVCLPLPVAKPSRDGAILRREELTNRVLAEYPTYAVVTDTNKRSPVYVVALIDQQQMKKTSRTDKWRIDTRIGDDFQLDDSYYVRNMWDRGHMARRESAGWGRTQRDAQKASDQTFYHANACLQHENVNQDEWLALEDWVQNLEIAKDGKIVVFAGPVYGESPRTVKPSGKVPAEVPAAFFKIVAFVNNGSKDAQQANQLDVRAFLMYQDAAAVADKAGRKVFEFQKYQVTVREIEELTDLEFPDQVYERNPLFYHPNERAAELKITSFPERVDVNSKDDLIGHDKTRTAVRDDDIQVYLAAAHVAPERHGEEWVSILNLETKPIDLAGWKLRDRQKQEAILSGVLQPGQAKAFTASDGLGPVSLPNDGGLIILLNEQDEQVDRVDYTKQDVKRAKDRNDKQLPIFFATYRW